MRNGSARSRASINGHPIHPMIIPFPMAFLIGGLLCDVLFLWLRDPFWARAAFWLIAGGLGSGLLAAVFGAVDFFLVAPVRRLPQAWGHALGNLAVLLVSAVNLGLRWDNAEAAVLPTGLILSAVVSVALGVTGWLGGEMSYRHRIGVTPQR